MFIIKFLLYSFTIFLSVGNAYSKSSPETFLETSSINSLPQYSIEDANIGVWLSGAAYCNKENYNSMKIGGPATGFIVKDILHDPKTDLQGYIGILPSTKTIYVVFRGTSSIRNWIDDMEILKVPYSTWNGNIIANGNIHKGFYESTLQLRNKTIDVVSELQKKYNYNDIFLTGHSYGAAVSQIMAMELEAINIKTKVYNYGQPRVGDATYAEFVNSIIKNYWRFTHNKDIVPHIPPLKFNYIHSCGEIFELLRLASPESNPIEDDPLNLITCSKTNCEDPKCSMQYAIYKTNINDHYTYLGHRLSCEDSSTLHRR